MRQRFNKILVAYDNSKASQSALQSALGVARKFEAAITAVVVVDDKNSGVADSFVALTSFANENGITIEIIQRTGSVHEEVLKLEKEGDFDLILQGSHGKAGWKGLWMGSNAFKVVSGSNCPVISVSEAANSPDLKHMLLPLADSKSTRQKVPYCIDLATAFGATVHILGVSKADSSDTINKVRSYVVQTEKYLLERGISCTVKEMYGVKVPESCIAYGEELNAGLMMMMTETESAGVFMDTYAQQLVNHSTIPVMTIHSRDTRLAGASGY